MGWRDFSIFHAKLGNAKTKPVTKLKFGEPWPLGITHETARI